MRCGVLALLSVTLGTSLACAQGAESRLKTVAETATVRIAYRTDSRPFSFLDPQGRPTGYSIELCERIAKSLERELRLPALAIQWVAVDTRTRFEAIMNGSADMECGSTTVSLSRMKIVDFSSLIFAESTGVMIKSGTGLYRSTTWPARRSGSLPGSTNAQAIRDQLERNASSTRDWWSSATARRASPRWRAATLDGFATDKLVLHRDGAGGQAARLHACSRTTCRSSRSPSCCRAGTPPSASPSIPALRGCSAAGK